jgi:hypothetical protein
MAFKRLFPQEQFNIMDFVRLFSSNVISDLSLASQNGSINGNIGSIMWFRFMQFWGTFQGYRKSGPLTWDLRKTFYYPTDSKSKSTALPRGVKPIQYNDIT